MKTLYHYKEVAMRWGVTERTVKEWKRKGLINYTRIGRNIRFTPEDLESAERKGRPI